MELNEVSLSSMLYDKYSVILQSIILQRGGLELTPADVRKEVGSTLGSSPGYPRADCTWVLTQRQVG